MRIKVGDRIEILKDNAEWADVLVGDILTVYLVDDNLVGARRNPNNNTRTYFFNNPESYRLYEEPTVGVKHDGDKPDMSLLSSIAISKIADVMTFGKKKYAAHNWRGGISYSRLLAATLRHTFAYLGGESVDPESGFSHLAHAGCCILMLLEFETTRPDLDDRYKPEVRR